MIHILKAEFYKLFHSWYFWGLTLFNLLLSSMLLLDSKSQTSNLFFASLYNTPVLYFLIIVFTALFIGNDFIEKTLYQYICAGHTRGQVFFAKVLVCQVACEVILLLPILLHGGVAEICLKENLKYTDNGIIIIVVGIMIMAMNMLPAFCAFVFQDIGKSFSIPMLMFLVMIFLMNGKTGQFVAKILPMGQLRLMALQEVSVINMSLIETGLLWIFVLYFGAYLIFRRSDLR